MDEDKKQETMVGAMEALDIFDELITFSKQVEEMSFEQLTPDGWLQIQAAQKPLQMIFEGIKASAGMVPLLLDNDEIADETMRIGEEMKQRMEERRTEE